MNQSQVSETEKPIPRGRPAFTQTQRERILDLLRMAGPAGISRAALLFEHDYTQCGARIDELKRQGFDIRSELRDGDRYSTYVLVAEPSEPKLLPTFHQKQSRDAGGDGYVTARGRERPHLAQQGFRISRCSALRGTDEQHTRYFSRYAWLV